MKTQTHTVNGDAVQTLVAVKQDGIWHFTAFHNCRIQEHGWFQTLVFAISTSIFHR
jgi:hypothetical protein